MSVDSAWATQKAMRRGVPGRREKKNFRVRAENTVSCPARESCRYLGRVKRMCVEGEGWNGRECDLNMNTRV